MVNFMRAAGLLAITPLIAAAPTVTDAGIDVRAVNVAVPFSFEKWAEDIIANPNGNHPSPEEAIALAFNETSTDGLEKRQADVSCTFDKPGGAASNNAWGNGNMRVHIRAAF
ncbi:hypothetical protein K4K53_005996 [Colletotrichum sp. SAR 10_77]|nr:hypothetical protein K4K53_005996 [Colletotrichum sp. SAR 10_77]